MILERKYPQLVDAYQALVSSEYYAYFDFDIILIDNVVGYIWYYDKTPKEAAIKFNVITKEN